MKTEATKIVTPFQSKVRRPIVWNFVRNGTAKVTAPQRPEDRKELPLAA
jgi:hypothetical protein